MTGHDLKSYRERAALTQTELAELLAMSLRQYQDVEGAAGAISPRLLQQLERVSLAIALRRLDPELALPAMRRDVSAFTAFVNGIAPVPPEGMVYVWGFKVFDPQKGETVRAPRRATAAGIKLARGQAIAGDADLVAAADVDGDGFVKKAESPWNRRYNRMI